MADQKDRPITPSRANRIIDDIRNKSITPPCPQSSLKDIFPDEDMDKGYTTQLGRWVNGTRIVTPKHELVKLFPFSQKVYSTGIPQSPALHNIRIPDEDFAVFSKDEARQGKAFVFDFFDAPPLWTSIKGNPSQILSAWKQVTAKAWLFWHPNNANVDFHDVDFTSWEWNKPLSPSEYFLRDEIALAETLERVSDHPVPPLVNLVAEIASSRLVGEKQVCIGPSFPSKEVQIELDPFDIKLNEIWKALEEVGCPPRFI